MRNKRERNTQNRLLQLKKDAEAFYCLRGGVLWGWNASVYLIPTIYKKICWLVCVVCVYNVLQQISTEFILL